MVAVRARTELFKAPGLMRRDARGVSWVGTRTSAPPPVAASARRGNARARALLQPRAAFNDASLRPKNVFGRLRLCCAEAAAPWSQGA
jgi:hypothetical protein